MTEYDVVPMLARFWGGVGVVFALIFLFKKDFLKNLLGEFDHLGALSASLGFMTIMIGIASLAIYSRFTDDWRVILTIYGWASVIKGVRILIVPDALNKLIYNDKFTIIAKFMLVVIGVISAFLLFKGIDWGI